MGKIKHYGDITKILGNQVEPVDIVCGGSPCQDLSVAGKRAGLAGARSGLFMEQIRIIKEMREHDRANRRADEHIRPRYMVWENVPGAFSSNSGEDFRAVLEETAKVAERDACIPRFEGGKWPNAGCIMGNGWSIAWRVHDAQFWGVPQRRKRIALVADFGGETAPEILFERKGLSGDTAESGKERKDAATDVRSGIEETGITCLNDQGGLVMGVSDNVSGTLRAQEHGHQPIVFEPGAASRVGGHVYVDDVAGTVRANAGDNQQAVVYGISAYESNSMKSKNPHSGVYEAETARTLDLNGGNPACNQGGMAVVCLEGNGSRPSHRGDGFAESETMYTLNSTEHHAVCQPPMIENDKHQNTICEDGISPTLTARMGTGGNQVNAGLGVGMSMQAFGNYKESEVVSACKARDYKDATDLVISPAYGLDRASFNQGENAKFNFSVDEEKVGALVAKGPGGVFQAVVRRLTPLECERLQGFPDGWTDIGDWIDSKGKKHNGDSDSPRYKALGNSIALPFWEWMAARMVKYIDHEPTMASLFDGIGGFPLAFSRAGCKPAWASEIEEFPIAVTKKQFTYKEV